MQAQYSLKVQTIRTRGMKERFYVYLPIPLAAAIGIRSGERVHWELVDRNELRLVRDEAAAADATGEPAEADLEQD